MTPGDSSTREKIPLDADWRFHLGDIEYEGGYWGWQKAGTCFQGGSRSRLDDSEWRRIDLPHDFVVERDFEEPDEAANKPHGIPEMWDGGTLGDYIGHGCLPRDVAWYRKAFDVSAGDEGRRIYLVFDGIYRASRTFLNDFYVGDHMSGYTGCCYDVTDFVNYGGTNKLAVKVDARESEGWWYEGGGIYRHAWIVKTNAVHVRPWGLFVWADFDPARPDAATVHVSVELRNRLEEGVNCEVTARILAPDGSEVARARTDASAPEWDESAAGLELQVDDPKPWSLDAPHLYRAVVEVRVSGELVDEVDTNFGIRSAVFDPERGFLLNGERVKLNGMSCHQDHAGVGIALPDSIREYRIRRLKDMACNAYRTAHNPPAPELLDLCDRLGMLVLVENRYFSGTAEHRDQLEAMVRIHRNHPSVIMWSIGNEEQMVHEQEHAPRIARTMRHVVRRFDQSRSVTMAIAPYTWFGMRVTPLEPILPLSNEIDVMGFNYCREHWLRYHEFYRDRPVVISEDTSCGATRGCYREDEEQCYHANLAMDGPTPEACVYEENWQAVAGNDCLSGIFVWTGFDYRGEPSPFGKWPQVIGNYGVMDLCGFPKDLFYYYRAQFTDEPLLHIFPHWNHPDMTGKPMTVYCYTNCHEVELFVNGQTAGRKTVERGRHVAWEGIAYEPGFIEAIGYANDRETARARVETTGEPHAVRLVPDRTELRADGMDAGVVNVEVVDEKGRVVPTARNEVVFTVEGKGRFIGAGNGDPCSHEKDKTPKRRAFGGLCQLIVRSSREAGTIKVMASAEGLQGDSIEIECG